MPHNPRFLVGAFALWASLALLVFACGENGSNPNASRAELRAQCAPDEMPDGAWVCSESLTVECEDGSADVEVVFVENQDQLTCEGELSVSEQGPFFVGTHTIEVSDDDGVLLCTTELTVRDTEAPELEAHTIQLWPPNHKLHAISVDDCVSVRDACKTDLRGEFIWGSSDEPVNGIGDGNHEPDIVFDDCERVWVRSERQGPSDGRVYRFGVRVVDASGNAAESECMVIVDHDQRGVQGVDSGEAYRIELNGANGTLECDGDGRPTAGKRR